MFENRYAANILCHVEWAEEKVHLDIDKDAVRGSPRYDPSAPVNREYETVLYDFYGRPHYWESQGS